MPEYRERTPRERETLIFPEAKAAGDFREHVQERFQEVVGPQAQQQVVREEIANEFAAHGEAVSTVKQPWEHTPAEHEEAQGLADISFAEDLGTAIRQAKASAHYPRNLDLLHDLLTGELYQYVKDAHINRQPLLVWGLQVAAILLIAALAVLFIVLSIG